MMRNTNTIDNDHTKRELKMKGVAMTHSKERKTPVLPDEI